MSHPNAPQYFIASDHAGFELKEKIKKQFPNISWQDLGTHSMDSTDYPTYADAMAQKIQDGLAYGVLICGSGQGMAMRANRHSHVRAALCWNAEVAALARQHNNANVLCLGARVMAELDCFKVVQVFLNTAFESGRHERRVDMLSKPTFCE